MILTKANFQFERFHHELSADLPNKRKNAPLEGRHIADSLMGALPRY